MSGRVRLVAAIVAAFAGALIAVFVIFGGDDEQACDYAACSTIEANAALTRSQRTSEGPPATAAPAEAAPVERAERKASGADRGRQAAQEGPSGPAPTTDPEKQASAAVDDFLAALDRGDGATICKAFAAGALEGVNFPEARSGCAATVAASLGYRDPRGLPVWRSSKPTGAISAKLAGNEARVTATVLTAYRGQREPSVEDDVLYLRRSGGRWLLLQPSATFYRAIGVADVPLDAFRPPAGS